MHFDIWHIVQFQKISIPPPPPTEGQWKFRGGGGLIDRNFGGVGGSSGTEIPRGWGVKIKKPSVGGYGYFLELHIRGSGTYHRASFLLQPSHYIKV